MPFAICVSFLIFILMVMACVIRWRNIFPFSCVFVQASDVNHGELDESLILEVLADGGKVCVFCSSDIFIICLLIPKT